MKELHVSAGSWSEPGARSRPIRRDTHDGPVPPEVLDLVPLVLRRCTRVEAVILECVGHSLQSADSAARFVADFRALKKFVHGVSLAPEREPPPPPGPSGEPIPLESVDLADFQRAMLDALAVETDPAGIHRRWLDDPRMAHGPT